MEWILKMQELIMKKFGLTAAEDQGRYRLQKSILEDIKLRTAKTVYEHKQRKLAEQQQEPHQVEHHQEHHKELDKFIHVSRDIMRKEI